MKALAVSLALFVAVTFAAAAQDDPYVAAARSLPAQHQHPKPTVPPTTLEEAERIALQSNPEILLISRKLAAIQARIPVAGALDDPSLMFRAWQVPLSQPWNLNDSMNMFMIGQNFPGPGKRALRSQIAGDAAAVAKADLEAKRREVSAEVRKAFYDLARNSDELGIHDEQVAIARQGLEAARIKYSVGRVPQQDVLKAQVALTKLVEHLVMLEQDGQLARATLNTLLGRDPDSPLEVSGDYAPPVELPALAALKQLALSSRPELAAVAAMINQSQDELKLARKAYSPDFSISGGYMLAPSGSEHRNNYMIEGSISLPWLNRRKHDGEITEAEARLHQQQAELAAARAVVFRQIQEALIRANSAKVLVDLYRGTLRPQSEATLRATVIAYQNDRTDILNLLDSQNTTLDVQYSYFRALAEYEARMAELEQAIGAPITRISSSGAEVRR